MANLFPKWMNLLPTVGAIAAGGGATTAIAGAWYWATPDFWEVGYMPEQPGSGFNHQIHAGQLGMDCRYCHTNVEKSPHSNVPAVKTCMGCHSDNKLGTLYDPGEKVTFVREAYSTDESIPWRKIHHLPGYVGKFPHHMHVAAGVSCYSCHGQITAMPVVAQQESLGMGWCLDCHRNPEEAIVPPDKVTDLVWVEEHLAARAAGVEEVPTEAQRILDRLANSVNEGGPQNCGACHH